LSFRRQLFVLDIKIGVPVVDIIFRNHDNTFGPLLFPVDIFFHKRLIKDKDSVGKRREGILPRDRTVCGQELDFKFRKFWIGGLRFEQMKQFGKGGLTAAVPAIEQIKGWEVHEVNRGGEVLKDSKMLDPVDLLYQVDRLGFYSTK
jgi:hypothetical protein